MLTDKQLNKMDRMLKALHDPNFEEKLLRAKAKLQAQINNGEIKQNGKRKKIVNEMDLVNEINNTKDNINQSEINEIKKAKDQEKLNNMKNENDFKNWIKEKKEGK